MIAAGAIGSFGHYLLIAGHRLAPASVLTPFIYTELIWMIALGYMVFGDTPNRWTIAGSAHRGSLRALPGASRAGASAGSGLISGVGLALLPLQD